MQGFFCIYHVNAAIFEPRYGGIARATGDFWQRNKNACCATPEQTLSDGPPARAASGTQSAVECAGQSASQIMCGHAARFAIAPV